MFRRLWDYLFAPRLKWVIVNEESDPPARLRIWLYWPDAEAIADVEENDIRPLVEMGWRVKCRPRLR